MLLGEWVWRGEKNRGSGIGKATEEKKWGEGQQKVVKMQERITGGQWSNPTQVSLQVNQKPAQCICNRM